MLPITHEHKNRQKWTVLHEMLNGKEINVKYAINTLNIVSLTARIAELKKLGFDIDWQWQITPNSRYKSYFLKDIGKARQHYQQIISNKQKGDQNP